MNTRKRLFVWLLVLAIIKTPESICSRGFLFLIFLTGNGQRDSGVAKIKKTTEYPVVNLTKILCIQG